MTTEIPYQSFGDILVGNPRWLSIGPRAEVCRQPPRVNTRRARVSRFLRQVAEHEARLVAGRDHEREAAA